SSSMVITWAVITPRVSWPTCSTASTSRPACVRRRPTSSASYGSGMGAYSRSQEIGTRIACSDLHPESPAEPHVTVVGVTDLVDAVREHQRPLDAKAEGEPAVAVRVDAAGHQDARV